MGQGTSVQQPNQPPHGSQQFPTNLNGAQLAQTAYPPGGGSGPPGFATQYPTVPGSPQATQYPSGSGTPPPGFATQYPPGSGMATQYPPGSGTATPEGFATQYPGSGVGSTVSFPTAYPAGSHTATDFGAPVGGRLSPMGSGGPADHRSSEPGGSSGGIFGAPGASLPPTIHNGMPIPPAGSAVGSQRPPPSPPGSQLAGSGMLGSGIQRPLNSGMSGHASSPSGPPANLGQLPDPKTSQVGAVLSRIASSFTSNPERPAGAQPDPRSPAGSMLPPGGGSHIGGSGMYQQPSQLSHAGSRAIENAASEASRQLSHHPGSQVSGELRGMAAPGKEAYGGDIVGGIYGSLPEDQKYPMQSPGYGYQNVPSVVGSVVPGQRGSALRVGRQDGSVIDHGGIYGGSNKGGDGKPLPPPPPPMLRKGELGLDFYFDGLDFYGINHQQFLNNFYDALYQVGVSEVTVKALRVSLRPGSIVAEVRGPEFTIGGLKHMLRRQVVVFGHVARIVDVHPPAPSKPQTSAGGSSSPSRAGRSQSGYASRGHPSQASQQQQTVPHTSKVAGALYVRVLAARRLRNGDTGLFGDVSDPYVICRVGATVRKTPVLDNTLNPVWEHGHEFVFPVSGKDGMLELEVMNSNFTYDTSLGTTSVALWKYQPGEWHRISQKLKNGGEGELDFELRFDRGVTPGDPMVAAAVYAAAAKHQPQRALLPDPRDGGLFYSMHVPPETRDQKRTFALPLEGVRVLEVCKRTWTAALCGKMLAACGADVVRIAFDEEAALHQKRMCEPVGPLPYANMQDHHMAGHGDPRRPGDSGAGIYGGLTGGGYADPHAINRMASQHGSFGPQHASFGPQHGSFAPQVSHYSGAPQHGPQRGSFGPQHASFPMQQPSHAPVQTRGAGLLPQMPANPSDGRALHFDRSKANTVPASLHQGKRILPYSGDALSRSTLERELLPKCDILLTDLPIDELGELQLTYQSLRIDNPGLIFVHTSCIGINADLNQKGVEDAGAFFCLTGFAEQLDHYLGPRGFAAATSASSLFGVTCMAVMRRRMGCPGDRVELSILRSGKLCSSLSTVTGWSTAPQAAQSNVGHVGHLQVRINAAHDLKNMDTGLLGDVSDPFVVVRIGKEEHKTPTINNNLNPVWKKDNMFTFNVRDASATLEFKVMNSNYLKNDCLGKLSVSLQHVNKGSWQKFRERLLDGNRNSQLEFDLFWEASSAPDTGVQANQLGRARQVRHEQMVPHQEHVKRQVQQNFAAHRPPTLPFDVLGAAQVQLGKQKEAEIKDYKQALAIRQRATAQAGLQHAAWEPLVKWRTRPEKVTPPPPQERHPVLDEKPLSRISVLEISDERSVSAAAVGSMLADLGAQVTKIERPKCPDPWKRLCPQLYHEMNSNKYVQQLDLPSLAAEAAMYKTLADTTMLVTNLPGQALEAWGLDIERMRQTFPHLLIVVISTWGCDGEARAREMREGRKGGQEVPAFWELSGLAGACFANRPHPPGLGELAVAQHALAGIGLALLRQQRTRTGQIVHCSRYQAGLYSRGISEAEPPAPGASPLLQTREGRFMRLLGRGHKPHDVWVLLHAVGKRGSLHESFQGNGEHIREHLSQLTWEDVQKCQAELRACAAMWSYEDLAKALNQKGIDWHCEELRPTDAESLHRGREGQAIQAKHRLEEVASQHRGATALVERHEHKKRDLHSEVERHKERGQNFEKEHYQKLEENIMRIERELASLPQQLEDLQHKEQYILRGSAAPTPHQLQMDPLGVDQQLQVQRGELDALKRAQTSLQQRQLSLQSQRKQLQQELEHPHMNEPVVGRLQVRILAAHDLKNTDTGLMGDVSDPYVVVRVGKEEHKTSTINNNLNPVWNECNLFTLSVREVDATLELIVMNENVFRNDAIGRLSVPLRHVTKDAWQKFKERLLDGNKNSQIEFDLYWEASSAWDLGMQLKGHENDLARARQDHETLSKELKSLETQVEMSSYASKWLMDLDAHTTIPLSVGEQALEEACHKGNLAVPAFLVSATGVDTLSKPPTQKVHEVVLFHEGMRQTKKFARVRVHINSASGIKSLVKDKVPDTFVRCEIPGKPASRFDTNKVARTGNPEWRERNDLRGFVPGDRVLFSIYQTFQGSKTEKLVGQTQLQSSKFYPSGFDGLLDIGKDISLRVVIVVAEEEVSM
eukprot:TRINITY_DN5300_c1_g3_i1.p1 TRINITY_DN5300_c1_g3~~TRINITY_DN5300_c1_g3_i1.p1  ORF type:complete len:2162 (-),score=437.98 TRINITY_DN5300_c1_g3_i1:113-6598(-)